MIVLTATQCDAGITCKKLPGTCTHAIVTPCRPLLLTILGFTALLHCTQDWGWSEESSFTTPPASQSDTPVRLLVTADIGIDAPDGAELPDDLIVGTQLKALGHLMPPGTSSYTLLKSALLATGHLTPAPGSSATRDLMQDLLGGDQPYHGVLLLGGMSMAMGHGAMWDDFLQQMQPVLTKVPLAAAPGDTEAADPALPGSAFASAASGGECGVPYSQRLQMPHKAAREMWYSTDMGAVHLVMLNSEQSLAMDSPQYRYGDGARVQAWKGSGLLGIWGHGCQGLRGHGC